MAFRNYDPLKVICSFKGIVIEGYGDAEFINVTRNEDAYSMIVGAGGDVTRIRSRDETGLVTVTLLAQSPSNDALQAAYDEDQAANATGELLLEDLNGTILATAPDAWIMKTPDAAYAKDGDGTREWQIACAKLTIAHGGASE